MTQFAQFKPPRQVALFYISDIRLDVEVLADCYEVLAALSPREDEPSEGAETNEETDDLPF